MTDTTGNFNDLVQLSGDTLYDLGEAFVIGNSLATTIYQSFSNSAGILQIGASHSNNETIWFPNGSGSLSSGGTLLTNILVSAGTTSFYQSAVAFSNANNVSFGLAGSTITAQAAVNFSAGANSVEASAITFSNLVNGNISFGLVGSTITANARMYISVPGFIQFATQLTFSNNAAISFGLTTNVDGGAIITATVVQPSILISAGTGAGYSSEFVFSNSNNISFGMQNAYSVITASYNFNISAGTTSNNLNAVTFSNSNGVSFGLDGSVVTASVLPNDVIVAGTQSFTGGTLSFANSNGFSFGMSNSSVITLDYGGFSSWSNGQIVSSFGSSNGFLSLNPIVVDYAITATNAIWLANFSGLTNSSGVISFSLGVYTLAGGTTGTLNLASSSTSAYTWTSGAAFSSQTGVGYRQMSLHSWAFTPGLYVFAFNAQTANSASMSLYGIYQLNTIVALASQLTNLVFPGLTQASTAGLPAAISVSNTSGYIRSGSSAFQQPWLLFQGT